MEPAAIVAAVNTQVPDSISPFGFSSCIFIKKPKDRNSGIRYLVSSRQDMHEENNEKSIVLPTGMSLDVMTCDSYSGANMTAKNRNAPET